MSDINTVAEVMGIPADLVSRSAAARAAESGSTTEDVLAAWGGGKAVASPPPTETAEDPAPVEPEPSEAPEDRTPEELPPPTIPTAPVGTPAVVEAGPYKPPILVGVKDNPLSVIAASVALFIGVLLLGLLGPSIEGDIPGARSTHIAYSEQGQSGQALYQTLECSACHTQMVRPIIADVGIGPVSLADTNQILGARRLGPDLSNIGARMSPTQMESMVAGSGGHPAFRLGDDDMSDLTTYLLESNTGPVE